MQTISRAVLLALLALAGCADDENEATPGPTPSEGTCTGVVNALGAGAPDPATAGCGTCVGERPPVWTLEDVQTQSCGHGDTYGPNVFHGRVTLLATLSAGCPYCQGQATKLEQMRLELDLAGTPVHIVAINKASQAVALESLLERCSFPIFQDTDDTDVWTDLSAGIGDFYIYDAEGKLVRLLGSAGEGRIDLTEGDGYSQVKGMLLDAME